MGALSEIKAEWHRFKDDAPGERFEHHRERMDAHPKWHNIVRGVAGVALIAVGVVFCFLPGPGVVGIAFGLALLAGMSRAIARTMDRVEPRMRAGMERARRLWQHLSTGKRALLVGVTTIVVAMGLVVVWRGWVGPVVASYVG